MQSSGGLMKKSFIIGKGASLKGFDFEILKDEYTFCLNHAAFVVPHASALCYCDGNFYKQHPELIDNFKGDIYKSTKVGPGEYIVPLYGVGSLSGLFALYVALQKSERVYLLGYDLNTTEEYPYFSNDFPGRGQEEFEKRDGTMKLFYNEGTFNSDRIARFEEIFSDQKHRVFNCNPDSAIKTFPFVDIKEVLSE